MKMSELKSSGMVAHQAKIEPDRRLVSGAAPTKTNFGASGGAQGLAVQSKKELFAEEESYSIDPDERDQALDLLTDYIVH